MPPPQPFAQVAAFTGRPFSTELRGGMVWLRLAGDRVQLGGRAVTVLRGELLQ